MEDRPYHWTQELFEEYPELFLGALEERRDRAPAEVDALLRYLKEQERRPKRVLDLNCGVGRHSIELGRRGIEVLGTDISTRYMETARQRAEEAGVGGRVSFQVADMRRIASRLAGEEPFDGIVCLWTSFGFYNDATNKKILRQCLKLVRRGGFFALDIVNRDWLLQNYSECRFARTEDGIVLQEGSFNPHDSRNHSTWTFLKQAGESTYTVEKSIKLDQRIWSLHELISLFEGAGWRFKAVYPGFFGPGLTPPKLARSPQDDDILKSAMLLVISCRP